MLIIKIIFTQTKSKQEAWKISQIQFTCIPTHEIKE